MLTLSDMHEKCGQCGFGFARIDNERWNDSSATRAMCPVCGWTRLEELQWTNGVPTLARRSESRGFGAYRLVPPGGYSGYNAFHSVPGEEVIGHIKELLNDKGWKGYLTLWDPGAGKARLVAGSPLHKFEPPGDR